MSVAAFFNWCLVVLLVAGSILLALLAPSPGAYVSIVVAASVGAVPFAAAAAALRRGIGWFGTGLAAVLNLGAAFIVGMLSLGAAAGIAGAAGLLIVFLPAGAALLFNAVILGSAFRRKWANPSIERTSSGNPEDAAHVKR